MSAAEPSPNERDAHKSDAKIGEFLNTIREKRTPTG